MKMTNCDEENGEKLKIASPSGILCYSIHRPLKREKTRQQNNLPYNFTLDE